MKHRFWESYIHRDKDAAKREDLKPCFKRHETKYYYRILDLITNSVKEKGVFTFTQVHNNITGGERDTIGNRDITSFHNSEIEIDDGKHSIVQDIHLGLSPEIYAHRDGYKITA